MASRKIKVSKMDLKDQVKNNLDELNIQYNEYDTRIAFSCPIHGSDNRNSLSILTDGPAAGTWKCWTNGCHEEYPGLKNLFKKLNEIYHTDVSTLFNITSGQSKPVKKVKMSEDRVSFRKKLWIPPKYFLDRGYTRFILDKYDVGYCHDKDDFLFNRIVVPIYNEEGTMVEGALGRNINEKCKECNLFHWEKRGCPKNSVDEFYALKWLNIKGFSMGEYLYNYWFVNKLKNNFIILTEGCGDVWKFEEAGIHCSLAMFGVSWSSKRTQLLEKLGVYKIVLALDNDEAGNENREKIRQKLIKYYDIYDIWPEGKDFGESSTTYIKEEVDKICDKM